MHQKCCFLVIVYDTDIRTKTWFTTFSAKVVLLLHLNTFFILVVRWTPRRMCHRDISIETVLPIWALFSSYNSPPSNLLFMFACAVNYIQFSTCSGIPPSPLCSYITVLGIICLLAACCFSCSYIGGEERLSSKLNKTNSSADNNTLSTTLDASILGRARRLGALPLPAKERHRVS